MNPRGSFGFETAPVKKSADEGRSIEDDGYVIPMDIGLDRSCST